MKRPLLFSKAFRRTFRSLAKKNRVTAYAVQATLNQLEENAFAPSLKTHKLKGQLDGFWSCSAGYDLRILFKFVDQQDGEAILLASVGTHDEVY